MGKLTHLDDSGAAHMVDVSAKDATAREGLAEGYIRMCAEALAAIREGTTKKGDVLAVARVDFAEHLLKLDGRALGAQLAPAPLRPDLRRGGQEDLDLRVGEDHRLNIAALHDQPAAAAVGLQLGDQVGTHLRDGGHHRGDLLHLRPAQRLGHVFRIHPGAHRTVGVGGEADLQRGGEVDEALPRHRLALA